MSWLVSAFADEAGPTTEEQIKALKKAGIKHIDPRSVESYNITTLPLDIAQDVARKYKEAGITVHMFGSPLGKIDISEDMNIDLDKLRHLGKLSSIFGCNKVRIFSYYNKHNVPADQWRDESLRRLQQLTALARELGLVLYHENERHIWGDTLEQVKTIVPLRGENFKLIFDFDNYNQSGDDVWNNWVALRDATDAFHLKDSSRGADGKHHHTPVGQGGGQVEKILADALSRGWNGPLVLEPHLKHSGAVAATGPSGQSNQAFKDMTHAECFQVAAETALGLMGKIKAPVV
jgi:sugar phosphate isomerase/epimerase